MNDEQQQQPQQQQQQQGQKKHPRRHQYAATDDWSYSRVPYFDTIMDTVDAHFPGSMPSWTTLHTVRSVIEQPRFGGGGGLTPSNTLFAQSICPDEVNHEPGNSIPNLFAEHFGKVFHLGGLGAIPFTGKTGFAAYASHVPRDNGHLFVLLAPHIGISDNGRHLGRYTRSRPSQSGQRTTTTTTTQQTTTEATTSSSASSSSPQSTSLSPCCGAAITALGIPDMAALGHQQQLEHQDSIMSEDDNDQEMAFLVQQINQHKHEILNSGATSENAMLANLARVNHNIALDYLHKIVQGNFGSSTNNNNNDDNVVDNSNTNNNVNNNNNNNNSTLFILTGIQINMPRPALQEFFQPLTFTVQYQNGTIHDLFNETFVVNNNYNRPTTLQLQQQQQNTKKKKTTTRPQKKTRQRRRKAA
jgi:Limiting CO2-inducible proteins B/C beta carbonyic anhydrases